MNCGRDREEPDSAVTRTQKGESFRKVFVGWREVGRRMEVDSDVPE